MPDQPLLVAKLLLDMCKVVMRVGIIRVDLERPRVTPLGILEPPEQFKRNRPVKVKNGIFRKMPDRFVKDG